MLAGFGAIWAGADPPPRPPAAARLHGGPLVQVSSGIWLLLSETNSDSVYIV